MSYILYPKRIASFKPILFHYFSIKFLRSFILLPCPCFTCYLLRVHQVSSIEFKYVNSFPSFLYIAYFFSFASLIRYEKTLSQNIGIIVLFYSTIITIQSTLFKIIYSSWSSYYPTLSWEPCEMIILFNFSFELLTSLLFSSTTNLSLSYYITFICYSSVHFILPLAHLGRLSMYLRARAGLQAAAYPTAISADCKLQRIYVCDCIGPVFRLICLSPLVF